MNDLSDTAPPKRRRASRKAAKPVDAPAGAPAEPAVRAILEHALQPDPEARAEAEVESALAEASSTVSTTAGPSADLAPVKSHRAPRRRVKSAKTAAALPQPGPAIEPIDATVEIETATEAAPAETGSTGTERTQAELVEAGTPDAAWADTAPFADDRYEADHGHDERHQEDPRQNNQHQNNQHQNDEHHGDQSPSDGDEGVDDGMSRTDSAPPSGHGEPPSAAPPPAPSHHHWVYLGLGVFLLALCFGLWGAWKVFFSGGDASDQSAVALTARSEKLSQEVSTLRRSDQISRDANRDLERTLAERDEEIAGLRADIAFYESFVGATGQRRGLSVHDLDMQFQGGDAWHFVATLTQNLNRGAVNAGRVTLSIEGTRNDRLEKLSWSGLRKQSNAPGVVYSFKYFQQVEGEVLLPKDFKPLRVSVRLVPDGGSAVEQSFPWPETVRSGEGG